MFTLSERYNRRRNASAAAAYDLEEFTVSVLEDISLETVKVRPGNVLVFVSNPYRLNHLEKALAETDTAKQDLVVLAVQAASAAASGEHDLKQEQIFGQAEREIFSRVVRIAEKAGKHVALLIVRAVDPWVAVVQTARKLQSSRVIVGHSLRFRNAEQQKKAIERCWTFLPEPRPRFELEILFENHEHSLVFELA